MLAGDVIAWEFRAIKLELIGDGRPGAFDENGVPPVPLDEQPATVSREVLIDAWIASRAASAVGRHRARGAAYAELLGVDPTTPPTRRMKPIGLHYALMNAGGIEPSEPEFW